MRYASHQSQLVRADIENLQRAVRDLNGHRTVASPDSPVARSNAMRLSAPTRARKGDLFEVGRVAH